MDWSYFLEVLTQEAPIKLYEHIWMSLISIAIIILIAVPIGMILSRPRYKKYSIFVLNILNLFLTVPPLAFIALFIPLLGLGNLPSITALVVLGLLPVARNTIAGLQAVDPAIKEAAMGMGMSKKKILIEIEMPLAMPIIVGGIKTSSVLVVSTATIAALIGGGGLGNLVMGGLTLFRPEYSVVGAGLGALLAISIDRGLSYIEYKITPPGMRSNG